MIHVVNHNNNNDKINIVICETINEFKKISTEIWPLPALHIANNDMLWYKDGEYYNNVCDSVGT